MHLEEYIYVILRDYVQQTLTYHYTLQMQMYPILNSCTQWTQTYPLLIPLCERTGQGAWRHRVPQLWRGRNHKNCQETGRCQLDAVLPVGHVRVISSLIWDTAVLPQQKFRPETEYTTAQRFCWEEICILLSLRAEFSCFVAMIAVSLSNFSVKVSNQHRPASHCRYPLTPSEIFIHSHEQVFLR